MDSMPKGVDFMPCRDPRKDLENALENVFSWVAGKFGCTWTIEYHCTASYLGPEMEFEKYYRNYGQILEFHRAAPDKSRIEYDPYFTCYIGDFFEYPRYVEIIDEIKFGVMGGTLTPKELDILIREATDIFEKKIMFRLCDNPRLAQEYPFVVEFAKMYSTPAKENTENDVKPWPVVKGFEHVTSKEYSEIMDSVVRWLDAYSENIGMHFKFSSATLAEDFFDKNKYPYIVFWPRTLNPHPGIEPEWLCESFRINLHFFLKNNPITETGSRVFVEKLRRYIRTIMDATVQKEEACHNDCERCEVENPKDSLYFKLIESIRPMVENFGGKVVYISANADPLHDGFLLIWYMDFETGSRNQYQMDIFRDPEFAEARSSEHPDWIFEGDAKIEFALLDEAAMRVINEHILGVKSPSKIWSGKIMENAKESNSLDDFFNSPDLNKAIFKAYCNWAENRKEKI